MHLLDIFKSVKKFEAISLFVGALYFSNAAFADEQKKIEWLTHQLENNKLVDSYKGDNRDLSYIYDQALSVIAFSEAGEFGKAKNVLDAIVEIQNSDGSWYSSYRASDSFRLDLNKDSGNVAWMIMAINYYEKISGDDNYYSVADKALNFLKSRIDFNSSNETFGSITHSTQLPNARSTEHAHDVYSAFYERSMLRSDLDISELEDIASNVKEYVRREMWAPSSTSNGPYHNVNVFWVGFNNFGWYTDPQSWGVLSQGTNGANGEEYFRSLDWLWFNPYGSTRNLVSYNDIEADGFRGNTGEQDFIWVEGTEGVASAFYSIGNTTRGDYFHNQMKIVEQDSGGLIFSFSDVNPEDNRRWPDNYRLEAINATAWHYFNERKINPFHPERKTSAKNWRSYK